MTRTKYLFIVFIPGGKVFEFSNIKKESCQGHNRMARFSNMSST